MKGLCKNMCVCVLKVAVCDYGEEGQTHTPRCFVVKIK